MSSNGFWIRHVAPGKRPAHSKAVRAPAELLKNATFELVMPRCAATFLANSTTIVVTSCDLVPRYQPHVSTGDSSIVGSKTLIKCPGRIGP